jgi:hypothetical protein
VGGTQHRVGVTFLDEIFSAANAPPEHRYHEKATRAVLKALLPEAGTDIKVSRRYGELLEASGYVSRPKDFDHLICILDSGIRLITPTDPSLRDWLTRKQKETMRGRAELRLAERAAAWNAKPENRHLPAWWELLIFRVFTSKRHWTAPQRKMIRNAVRYHAIRGFIFIGGLVAGARVHRTSTFWRGR